MTSKLYSVLYSNSEPTFHFGFVSLILLWQEKQLIEDKGQAYLLDSDLSFLFFDLSKFKNSNLIVHDTTHALMTENNTEKLKVGNGKKALYSKTTVFHIFPRHDTLDEYISVIQPSKVNIESTISYNNDFIPQLAITKKVTNEGGREFFKSGSKSSGLRGKGKISELISISLVQ